jgi:hypothetical protein
VIPGLPLDRSFSSQGNTTTLSSVVELLSMISVSIFNESGGFFSFEFFAGRGIFLLHDALLLPVISFTTAFTS